MRFIFKLILITVFAYTLNCDDEAGITKKTNDAISNIKVTVVTEYQPTSRRVPFVKMDGSRRPCDTTKLQCLYSKEEAQCVYGGIEVDSALLGGETNQSDSYTFSDMPQCWCPRACSGQQYMKCSTDDSRFDQSKCKDQSLPNKLYYCSQSYSSSYYYCSCPETLRVSCSENSADIFLFRLEGKDSQSSVHSTSVDNSSYAVRLNSKNIRLLCCSTLRTNWFPLEFFHNGKNISNQAVAHWLDHEESLEPDCSVINIDFVRPSMHGEYVCSLKVPWESEKRIQKKITVVVEELRVTHLDASNDAPYEMERIHIKCCASFMENIRFQLFYLSKEVVFKTQGSNSRNIGNEVKCGTGDPCYGPFRVSQMDKYPSNFQHEQQIGIEESNNKNIPIDNVEDHKFTTPVTTVTTNVLKTNRSSSRSGVSLRMEMNAENLIQKTTISPTDGHKIRHHKNYGKDGRRKRRQKHLEFNSRRRFRMQRWRRFSNDSLPNQLNVASLYVNSNNVNVGADEQMEMQSDISFRELAENHNQPEIIPQGDVPQDSPYGEKRIGTSGLCMEWELVGVREADSGQYSCQVRDMSIYEPPVYKSLNIEVRAPIKVSLNVTAENSTAIRINWLVVPWISVHLNLSVLEPMNNPNVANDDVDCLDSLTPRTYLWKTSDGTWAAVYHRPNLPDSDKDILVSGLKVASLYKVQISLIVRGPKFVQQPYHLIDSKVVMTMEDVPDAPIPLDVEILDKLKRRQCRVMWTRPNCFKGPIIRYELEISGSVRWQPSVYLSSSYNWSSTDIPTSALSNDALAVDCSNISNIRPRSKIMLCDFVVKPNRNYTARIRTYNSFSESTWVDFKQSCITNFDVPDGIDHMIPYSQSGENETFSISSAKFPEANGPITCYYVAVVAFPYNLSITDLKVPALNNFAHHSKALESLNFTNIPHFAYIAESINGSSIANDVDRFSVVIGNQQQDVGRRCRLDYFDRYPAFDDVLLPGFKYTAFVIVRVQPDDTVFQHSTAGERMKIKRDATWLTPSYGYSKYSRPVIVGNGNPSDYKVDDEPGTPLPEESSPPTTSSSSHTAVVVSVITVLLLILVAITFLAYLFLYRNKYYKQIACCIGGHKSNNEFSELNPIIPKSAQNFAPIPIGALPGEYIIRHKDSDFLFTTEFDSLPFFDFDTTASDLPENVHKNRYNDIKAYELTRIRLPLRTDDHYSDYINANWIEGYKGRRLFIAAQGPKEETIADFWRMIWENHCKILLMVTNLKEKYRSMCVKYWPDVESAKFGEIIVTANDITIYADYTVRKFTMSKVMQNDSDHDDSSQEQREVVQLQYTGWNDYRAPESAIGLLRFINRAAKLDGYDSSPVVVHCSAGVGRTGTYIAIDALLEQMCHEKHVDIFGYVSLLRRQRNFMVQSLEQYVFIYKALAEWHLFGETDSEAEKFKGKYENLLSTVATNEKAFGSNSSLLRKEFERLKRTLEDSKSAEFAQKECNAAKNRYATSVPFDRNRVILSPIVGHIVDASYINASVVQGYLRSYILAQDPLSTTLAEWWRMIWEQRVATIVMLTQEFEIDYDERYWPEAPTQAVTFGERPALAISLVAEEQSSTFIQRRLQLTHSKEKCVREVVQYLFTDWNIDQQPLPSQALISGGHYDYLPATSSNTSASPATSPRVKTKEAKCSSPTSSSKPTIDLANNVSVVPHRTASLLEVIGKVLQRETQLSNDPYHLHSPILIHCRNGCDRSGLYCALSILLERLKQEQRIDVFQTVKALQAQRPHLLESLLQYQFCYQAVVDYLESFR